MTRRKSSRGWQRWGWALLLWGAIAPAAAANVVPSPSAVPLNLQHLEVNVENLEANVVRADTPSQSGSSDPSLWWAAERFGGKLLETWLAYPATSEEPGRVDLVVNRQLWSLADYFDRYRFINHFGNALRRDRYNLRVFVRQRPDRPVATYTCVFNEAANAARDLCHINLSDRGQFFER